MKRNRWRCCLPPRRCFSASRHGRRDPPDRHLSSSSSKLQLKRTRSKATPRRSRPAWALPRPLRRLPRHGRPRRPRPRSHPGLGLGPDRRRAVPDAAERRAGHRDAGRSARARPITRSGRSSPTCARSPRRPPTDPPRGNADNGERLFRAKCASCHRVNGRGGRLGPDLSRIGVARARDVLVRQHPRRRRRLRGRATSR